MDSYERANEAYMKYLEQQIKQKDEEIKKLQIDNAHLQNEMNQYKEAEQAIVDEQEFLFANTVFEAQA